MTTPPPPQSPRPDQRLVTAAAGGPGSRSGSGELAGALGFPGVPAAVPNLQGASIFQQGVSITKMVTFPAAARIWAVLLSFSITSNNSFSLATVRTVAAVQTVTGGLTLAVVQLGVANNNQHAEGTSPMGYPGVPVVAGEIIRLNVSNNSVIPNCDQQASASVLYSVP
jgi:hypothetical protein